MCCASLIDDHATFKPMLLVGWRKQGCIHHHHHHPICRCAICGCVLFTPSSLLRSTARRTPQQQREKYEPESDGWGKSTRCVGKSLMMTCSARWDALIVERVNGEPTDQQPSTPHAFASAAHPTFTCGPCKQGEKSVKCALALPTDLERKLVGGHLLATASNAQSTKRIEACSHHAMPAYSM